MALVNFSLPSLTTMVPGPTYNPDILEIFKENGVPENNTNIYVYVTEPPNVKNATKDSNEIPQWKQNLNKVFSLSMGIVLVVLMLGMGSHVYWKEVVGNLWPPLPILIGMTGQFIILPALAFGISVLFKMDPYVALGCLIISSSPGGAFSNFYTYWVYGDVALSLVMTTCSTILSFGTMPLNILIYSPNIIGTESEKIVIPYKNILSTLGFVCGPVIVGMAIRHFSERIADKTTQIASIIGYVIVTFNVISIFILFWDMLASASWSIHASVIILPMSGMILAYLMSFISGRSHKICRTIAIETASQNIPVAMGIVVMSFPELEVRNQMLLYPTLYAIYMFIEIFTGALLFRWYYYRKQKAKLMRHTESKDQTAQL